MTDENTNTEGTGSPALSAHESAQKDAILREHMYDGIQEYDNPMPGWWLWIFWATVIFAPIYILGVHVFDFIPSYEDDLAAGQAEIQSIREAYESTTQPFEITPETMAAYIGVQEHIDAGAAIFSANCLMCHGDKGQGLIGPNLTDNYWIHGNEDANLFNVITNGVPEKGMTAWANILSPEQRAQVIAFIRTLAGTNPPGGRDPEGELYEAD